MAALSVSAFSDALANLAQAIEFAEKHKKLGDEAYYKQFRTAAIQSFEYSYDIGQKLIKRYVEEGSSYDDEHIDLEYRDYMRVAAEFGLLTDPELWVELREWRNETSHTYDFEIAESLFRQLQSFLESMRYTCGQMEKRDAFDA